MEWFGVGILVNQVGISIFVPFDKQVNCISVMLGYTLVANNIWQ